MENRMAVMLKYLKDFDTRLHQLQMFEKNQREMRIINEDNLNARLQTFEENQRERRYMHRISLCEKTYSNRLQNLEENLNKIMRALGAEE